MMQVGDVADLKAPVLKAATAWIAALGTSIWDIWYQVHWDKFAQFAAFIYSLCLLWEFLKKKTLKERRKQPRRIANDSDQSLS